MFNDSTAEYEMVYNYRIFCCSHISFEMLSSFPVFVVVPFLVPKNTINAKDSSSNTCVVNFKRN